MIKTKNGFTISFMYSDKHNPITICYLEDIKEDRLYTGSAYCHYKDRFVKSIGRKLSLQRAMLKAGLSKDERTQVWADYFGRNGENVKYD